MSAPLHSQMNASPTGHSVVLTTLTSFPATLLTLPLRGGSPQGGAGLCALPSLRPRPRALLSRQGRSRSDPRAVLPVWPLGLERFPRGLLPVAGFSGRPVIVDRTFWTQHFGSLPYCPFLFWKAADRMEGSLGPFET